MKKIFLLATLLAILLIPAISMARTDVFFNFGIGFPAPFFVAPAPVFAPAPVVVAPGFVFSRPVRVVRPVRVIRPGRVVVFPHRRVIIR